MRLIWQLVVSCVVLAATAFLWLTYVPAAASFLDRIGVADLLGVEIADARTVDGAGGFGSRGPARVIVANVTEATANDVIEAIGDGRALRAALLRVEVGGEVVDVAAATGGRVARGAVILRLEDEAERIAVERAQLVLQDARDDVDRLSRLQGTGSVSEVRLRESRLALRSAELDLREAEYDLAQRTIRAPFDGWLGLLDVSVGDRLSPQDEIATLTDRSEILIDFRVPERIVGRVAPGMPLQARPLGISGAPLMGTVRAVDNVVDPTSRTLRVQGRVSNDDDRLRAGMALAVSLRFAGDRLIAVSPLAVQWAAEGSFVWAVQDGMARRVSVTIRQRDADRVLVTGDLAPGDIVVVEGVQSLRPGAEVALANRQEAVAADIPPAQRLQTGTRRQ